MRAIALSAMPKPIHLLRRRWTFFFSAPFTLFLIVACGYCLILVCVATDRLIIGLAAFAAFCTFCVGGTVGRTVLEALRDKEPAVTVDADGLYDARSETGLIPWDSIERVKLDCSEQRILIYLTNAAARDRSTLARTARRLLSGADCVIALGGLRYNDPELARSLDAFHRQSRTDRLRDASASPLAGQSER